MEHSRGREEPSQHIIHNRTVQSVFAMRCILPEVYVPGFESEWRSHVRGRKGGKKAPTVRESHPPITCNLIMLVTIIIVIVIIVINYHHPLITQTLSFIIINVYLTEYSEAGSVVWEDGENVRKSMERMVLIAAAALILGEPAAFFLVRNERETK